MSVSFDVDLTEKWYQKHSLDFFFFHSKWQRRSYTKAFKFRALIHQNWLHLAKDKRMQHRC